MKAGTKLVSKKGKHKYTVTKTAPSDRGETLIWGAVFADCDGVCLGTEAEVKEEYRVVEEPATYPIGTTLYRKESGEAWVVVEFRYGIYALKREDEKGGLTFVHRGAVDTVYTEEPLPKYPVGTELKLLGFYRVVAGYRINACGEGEYAIHNRWGKQVDLIAENEVEYFYHVVSPPDVTFHKPVDLWVNGERAPSDAREVEIAGSMYHVRPREES